MAFDLSDDEQNGVLIAVNTILKHAYGIGEIEDWSYVHDEWWDRHRPEFNGRSAKQALAANPTAVVRLALKAPD